MVKYKVILILIAVLCIQVYGDRYTIVVSEETNNLPGWSTVVESNTQRARWYG